MAVSSVTGNSNAFNNQYATQGAAEAKNSEMSMDDFWQLMAAQLQYQDMTNPMSNSEMMNQMTQMATMNAMTQCPMRSPILVPLRTTCRRSH